MKFPFVIPSTARNLVEYEIPKDRVVYRKLKKYK